MLLQKIDKHFPRKHVDRFSEANRIHFSYESSVKRWMFSMKTGGVVTMNADSVSWE